MQNYLIKSCGENKKHRKKKERRNNETTKERQRNEETKTISQKVVIKRPRREIILEMNIAQRQCFLCLCCLIS
jgi:hypothetical protein